MKVIQPSVALNPFLIPSFPSFISYFAQRAQNCLPPLLQIEQIQSEPFVQRPVVLG